MALPFLADACGAAVSALAAANAFIAAPVRGVLASLSQASGLPLSQVSFLVATLLNCPIAAATRFLPKGSARHAYGTLSTLGLLTLAYGRDVEQFVYAGALVYLFMRFFPRHCGYLTWGTIFSYQVYLHYERASEEAWNAGELDFTGSFMMLTLRLISIAMDYQDGARSKGRSTKKTAEEEGRGKRVITALPPVLEYSGYLGAIGAVLVGPHFFFHDYLDYANSTGEYALLNTDAFPGVWGPAVKAMMASAFSAALYFKTGSLITNRAAVLTWDSRKTLGIWGKLLVGFVCNVNYRLKLYFAWHLEEAVLILSGFGFSGFSTSDGVTPVWTKAVSAAMIECEMPPSAAISVVKWNRHTGTWLRTYVYDRIPMKGLAALLVTQTVCGLWHGCSPSFILFFSHSAVLIYSSRILYRIQTKYMAPETLSWTNPMHSFYTTFMLSYIAGGYNVVSLQSVLDWWQSVGWIGHYIFAAVFAAGAVFPKPNKPKDKSRTKNKTN